MHHEIPLGHVEVVGGQRDVAALVHDLVRVVDDLEAGRCGRLTCVEAPLIQPPEVVADGVEDLPSVKEDSSTSSGSSETKT
jgi:hypothetical protein